MNTDNRDLPAEWADAMTAVEAWDPRNKRPSINALGRMAKVHPTTIGHMIHGTRDTDDKTIAAVADVLGKNIAEMHALMAIRGTDAPGRFELPEGADRLTRRQRRAVTELILSILEEPAAPESRPHPATDEFDLAAHPPLDTPGSRRRAADKTLGEESQETGYDD